MRVHECIHSPACVCVMARKLCLVRCVRTFIRAFVSGVAGFGMKLLTFYSPLPFPKTHRANTYVTKYSTYVCSTKRFFHMKKLHHLFSSVNNLPLLRIHSTFKVIFRSLCKYSPASYVYLCAFLVGKPARA